MFNQVFLSENQSIDTFSEIRLTMKREDQIHPVLSGNKYRKLKYNFQRLKSASYKKVFTFGGAFSNHLAAVAAAGISLKIPTIGIVRGEEWEFQIEKSPTLTYCQSQGMILYFISRDAYREKKVPFPYDPSQDYLLPEGGTNALAIEGCKEILNNSDTQFDTVCCCVGTGGTLAGLIEASASDQEILGFPALMHRQLEGDIQQWTRKDNWALIRGFEFGGYARTNEALVGFMNYFYQQYGIPLDPIYTGKMLFGIFELIKKGQWRWGNNVLIIHTGGLQGIQGFNQHRLEKGHTPLCYSSA